MVALELVAPPELVASPIPDWPPEVERDVDDPETDSVQPTTINKPTAIMDVVR